MPIRLFPTDIITCKIYKFEVRESIHHLISCASTPRKTAICTRGVHLKVAAKFNCPIVKELDELAVMPAANVQEVGGGKACGKRKKPAANANYNDTPPQAFAF
jgi:hypothetical protein